MEYECMACGKQHLIGHGAAWPQGCPSCGSTLGWRTPSNALRLPAIDAAASANALARQGFPTIAAPA